MKTRLLQLSTFLAAFLGFAQFAAAQYCTPSYSLSCQQYYMTVRSFSTSGGSVNITNNNQSGNGCGNNAGYSYYSTLGHTTAVQSVVNFSVSTGPTYNVRVYLWVDYNQDGDFIDAGEQVAYNNNVGNNSTWASSFTIPATANIGTTRMRIRTLYYGSSGMHPCNNLPYGESEDYNLTIGNSLSLTSAAKTGACPGQDSVTVAYNTYTSYLNSGNSVTAQMSDTSGSFASATTLGSWSTTAIADSAQFAIPNILAHPGYQIRLISSNPADTSSNLGLGFLSTFPESPSWIFFSDTNICSADSVSFYDTLGNSSASQVDTVITDLFDNDITTTYADCGQGKYSCGAPISLIYDDSIAGQALFGQLEVYTRINCGGGGDSLQLYVNGTFVESQVFSYLDCSCSEQGGNQLFTYTFDPTLLNPSGPDTLNLMHSANNCVSVDNSSVLDNAIARVTQIFGPVQTTQYSLASSFSSIISEEDTFTTYVSSNTDYYYRSLNNLTGCYSDTFEVQTIQIADLAVSASLANDVSCFGDDDGAITASSTGGIGTVLYSVDGTNWQASVSLTGLEAGSYVVYARDDESCMDSTTAVVVDEPAELVAVIDSSQSASCADNEDGYAYINVTGGTAGYSYLWSDSVTTALNENLGVGEYIVVVTDGNGCATNDTIGIIFEDSIAPMVMVQNIIAYLDSTGSATITASQIDNGSSDSCGIAQMIISDSVFACDDTLNEVIFTVFDVNGNFASDTAIVTITDTIAPSIMCADSMEICEGELILDSAITTDNCASSVSQIIGPMNGDSLMTGSYTSEFLAVDIFGNESSCSVDIMVNPLPVIELGNDSLFCDSIEFTVDAGNDGSSFDWSTGESSQTILVTDSGNYTVTVTDANGCESSSSIHVGLKVCVGIDEVGNPIYMTVYPNPTTNMVNVQIDGFADDVRYDILDIDGKLVQSSNRNGVSASSIEVIDISSFSSGIYILSVKVNDKTYVQRISKM